MPHSSGEEQEQQIQSRTAPNSRIVHDAVLREGADELERPSSALAWSGLAAGLSMGFSLVAEGLLQAYLPEAPWRPLVSKLGYSVGFLVVILGRQQLFTENTLTPILPLLDRKDIHTAFNVLRLWTIVLLTNLLGGALTAIALTRTSVFDPAVRESFLALARETTEPGWTTIVLRGIFSGWLIALLVWLMPFAETARVWVIIILTYVIGLGHLSHVIAGSIEAAALAAVGELTWTAAFTHFTVPCLLGNIIGGVALVAAINHAQVVAGHDAPDPSSRQKHAP